MQDKIYRIGTEDASWSRLALLWFGDTSLGWLLYRYQVESRGWTREEHHLEVGWPVRIPEWPLAETNYVVPGVPLYVLIDNLDPFVGNRIVPEVNLADVSMMFYGTKSFVTRIMERNSMDHPALEAGQVLIIPVVAGLEQQELALRYRESRGL